VLNSSQDISTVEPLVSVGIPTFNRPQGLRRTLECITQQTYKNLEIIVSDNCSSGSETNAVIQGFMKNDKRIQYFHQESNKGITFNFQFVLQKATGDYFMWAADDDEWKETFIEKCLKEFLNNDSLVLCYSEPIKKNYQGQSEVLLPYDTTTVGMKKINGIKKFLLNSYSNYEFYGLMKKRIASLYTWENYFGEDHVFVLFLALHGEIGKTAPGLFISGPGFAGSSVERQVQSFGLSKINLYFGYIFLILKSIRMVFSYGFDLNIIKKIQIVFLLFRRTISMRYMRAIGAGIKTLTKDMTKSMKIKPD
jgi:glycosyltransferase involved in cell wall biosynthesis